MKKPEAPSQARLAQLVERKALNLVVVGSSPTVGALCFLLQKTQSKSGSRQVTTYKGESSIHLQM